MWVKNLNIIYFRLVFFFCLWYNVIMQLDLTFNLKRGSTIAVALSGGGDSMALLNYMLSIKEKYAISVIALNVEHGIRGEESKNDTLFVTDYCAKNDVTLLSYTVDAIAYAKKEKLSIEQSARALRYQCFFDAINNGKCDAVATAHHADDNTESVLLNLFRGSGIKGLTGIKNDYDGKILRPFLSVTKQEIEQYLASNRIPYVTDKTNLSDEYTRNYLRLNVIPEIKKIFPELNKSIVRITEIASAEDEFMDSVANRSITDTDGTVKIALPQHRAILSRAIIIAMQKLGVEKDWQKCHVDDCIKLSSAQNGTSINLPKSIVAIKEYDALVLYVNTKPEQVTIPFSIGTFTLSEQSVSIEKVDSASAPDLKAGLFGDLNKIPSGALIRFKHDGDRFTKFGGGTKSLNDYLTDKKIPLRLRNTLPILADGNDVLVIFGIASSNRIKVDENTTDIIKFI